MSDDLGFLIGVRDLYMIYVSSKTILKCRAAVGPQPLSSQPLGTVWLLLVPFGTQTIPKLDQIWWCQLASQFSVRAIPISGWSPWSFPALLLYSSCLSEVSCVRVKPDQALSPQNWFHVGYQWGYFMVFLGWNSGTFSWQLWCALNGWHVESGGHQNFTRKVLMNPVVLLPITVREAHSRYRW